MELIRNRWSGFSDLDLELLLNALERGVMCGAPTSNDMPDYVGPINESVVTMVRELRLELLARGVFSADELDEAGNLVKGDMLVGFNSGVVGVPQAIEASWSYIDENWGYGLRSRG